jgi:hypothetical protein
MGERRVTPDPLGSVRKDAAVVGGTRGQVLVENLKRVGSSRKGRLYPQTRERLGVPVAQSPRRMCGKSTGRKGPGSRFHGLWGNALERRKTQESIDPAGPSGSAIGIRILAGRKALELRGIVILWSSEQKNAMSETARGQRRRKARGSARGKSSAG